MKLFLTVLYPFDAQLTLPITIVSYRVKVLIK